MAGRIDPLHDLFWPGVSGMCIGYLFTISLTAGLLGLAIRIICSIRFGQVA